jgi:hypothetical protein
VATSKGGRDEVLHLVGPVAVALEEQRQVDHEVQVGADRRLLGVTE